MAVVWVSTGDTTVGMIVVRLLLWLFTVALWWLFIQPLGDEDRDSLGALLQPGYDDVDDDVVDEVHTAEQDAHTDDDDDGHDDDDDEEKAHREEKSQSLPL